METIIVKTDKKNMKRVCAMAAKLLGEGEIVAFPTETVYGLGANAFDGQAVGKIFGAKGRPADNPLIVHIGSIEDMETLAHGITPVARSIAKRFWPGPLTMVLPKKDRVPDIVTASLDTVALRMPQNEIALELLRQCRFPIAAPSANLSGRPSPTKAEHVFEDFRGKIPMIIDGGKCDVGIESTVISINGDSVTILRPGDITPEDLAEFAAVKLHSSILAPEEGFTAESPGMKYTHYAPRARITVVSGKPENVSAAVKKLYDEYERRNKKTVIVASDGARYPGRDCMVLNDARTAARELFGLLRDFDAQGYDEVIAEAMEPSGLGLAVMNRLLRASGFNAIEV